MLFLKTCMNSVYCNSIVKSQQFKSHLFLMSLEDEEPKIKVTAHVATGKGSSRETLVASSSERH